MIRILKVITIAFVLSALTLPGSFSFAANDILITRGELAKIVGKPGVVIVDARSKRSYKKRHLPGAVNLPAKHIMSLRDEASIKKFAVPVLPEKAEKLFGGLGMANDSTIVVYDTPPDFFATYVWFTLRMYGAGNVRILSGGIKGWKKEKLPLTKEVPKVEETLFKANIRSDIIINADWIIKNRERIQLIDTRGLEEFVGARGVGHIPGALLLEWKQLTNAKKSFKSAAEMNKIISKKGVPKDKEIVIYCEIGVMASVPFAAFDMLGYNPKFYWGSMKDWQDDPNRPIAKK